jgi:hypothetical protein
MGISSICADYLTALKKSPLFDIRQWCEDCWLGCTSPADGFAGIAQGIDDVVFLVL